MARQTQQSDNVAATRSAGRLELNMLSHPNTLRPMRLEGEAFCREAGLSAKESDEIGLVLNEAVANVMRHQYGGATDRPIRVTFERRGGELEIAIRDWGAPFDPAKLSKPKLEEMRDADHLKPGGLGLICMYELMDKVEFIRQSDGMLLTMVKKIG